MVSKVTYAGGVDVGASRTKVAILDSNKNLIGHAVKKSGIDFAATADACLAESLRMAGIKKGDIEKTIATGYGRNNVSFARDTKTEIGCHARGCFLFFPFSTTIIDIGGQDNKIIKVDQSGKRTGFKMNRKCAAGTGAFLEEMAMRLDVTLDEMDRLASQSENMVKLGSFCTVFSATEVLENIRQGKKLADIVKGVFFSMIKRVLEMDSLTQKVVMTGGVVAHNPFMVKMTEEIIDREVLVPDYPQLTGAIGAAGVRCQSKNVGPNCQFPNVWGQVS
jgi:predicted CoA-substrate-specific enzyme activase